MKTRKYRPTTPAAARPPTGARWHIDLSTGGHALRAGMPPDELLAMWNEDGRAFVAETEPFRLYP